MTKSIDFTLDELMSDDEVTVTLSKRDWTTVIGALITQAEDFQKTHKRTRGTTASAIMRQVSLERAIEGVNSIRKEIRKEVFGR